MVGLPDSLHKVIEVIHGGNIIVMTFKLYIRVDVPNKNKNTNPSVMMS